MYYTTDVSVQPPMTLPCAFMSAHAGPVIPLVATPMAGKVVLVDPTFTTLIPVQAFRAFTPLTFTPIDVTGSDISPVLNTFTPTPVDPMTPSTYTPDAVQVFEPTESTYTPKDLASELMFVAETPNDGVTVERDPMVSTDTPH